MDKVPVLVYTDLGRDVDDLEAIAYIAGSDSLKPVAIATTSMIPKRRGQIARAVLDSLGYSEVPVGIGSVHPLSGEDPSALEKYLKEHQIEGESYEGKGILDDNLVLDDDSLTADEVITESVQRYGSDLAIAVLAPPTDLAKAILRSQADFTKVGGIYVMGQAIEKDGKLVPDAEAYNLQLDMPAANTLFELQDDVPFTFVTKHAAYQTPLNRKDFEAFQETGHPVGSYLRVHAEKGLECFVRRAPEIFKRVFNIPAGQDAYEAFQQLEKLSNPYDALTVMAIDRPDMFSPVSTGKHKVIGQSPENPGIEDSSAVKQHLMQTMLTALR